MSDKDDAEINKLRAETRKLNTEATFYPIIAIGGLLAAMVALGKILTG